MKEDIFMHFKILLEFPCKRHGLTWMKNCASLASVLDCVQYIHHDEVQALWNLQTALLFPFVILQNVSYKHQQRLNTQST